MNRRQMNKALLLASVAAASGWLGPGVAHAGQVVFQPIGQPTGSGYEHRGVRILPGKIFLKGKKLWFELSVINNTGKLLTIDKNQLTLLVDGAELPREQGVFGKFAKPHLINPGLSHPLAVEFIIGEIPKPVALVLKQGFIVDGKSLPLPEYPVTPVAAN